MITTPLYYYDMDLLSKTLCRIQKNIEGFPFKVHYALKANAEEKILNFISSQGFGADCVSGNEVERALNCSFSKDEVVLAGVGKSDKEIRIAIDHNIHSINCESIEEIQVVSELSAGKDVNIALRINPDIDASTHPSITTGTSRDKFGIPLKDLWTAIEEINSHPNLTFIGLHFHLGSQITKMKPFENLCNKVNSLQTYLASKEVPLLELNMGGGLGIDYIDPINNQFSDFENYFKTFKKHLILHDRQVVHFELGRSIVGQSGSLITKVLYVKSGEKSKFVIIDAGMTELIRPALYKSYHAIENLTSIKAKQEYQVVGPICESTDTFGSANLPETTRGDYLKIHSAGAYGQVLASNYNLRDTPPVLYSDQTKLSKYLSGKISNERPQ